MKNFLRELYRKGRRTLACIMAAALFFGSSSLLTALGNDNTQAPAAADAALNTVSSNDNYVTDTVSGNEAVKTAPIPDSTSPVSLYSITPMKVYGNTRTAATQAIDVTNNLVITKDGNSVDFSQPLELKFDDTIHVEYQLKDFASGELIDNMIDPDSHNIVEVEHNSVISFPIPEEIAPVLTDGNNIWNVVMKDKTTVWGEAKYDSDSNSISVQFTSDLLQEGESSLEGAYIGFAAKLNEEKVGDDAEVTLRFEAFDPPQVIKVVCIDNRPTPSTIAKKGEIDPSDSNTIDWTVTVTEGSEPYTGDMTIEDIFTTDNHDYVPDSLAVTSRDENGSALAASPAITELTDMMNGAGEKNGIRWTYTPTNTKGNVHTFTYKTKFNDKAIKSYINGTTLNGYVNLKADNEATLIDAYEGTPISGPVPGEVSKGGSYTWVTKTLEDDDPDIDSGADTATYNWKIIVDTNGQSFTNLVVKDSSWHEFANSDSTYSIDTDTISVKEISGSEVELVKVNDTDWDMRGNGSSKGNISWQYQLQNKDNPTDPVNGVYEITYQTVINNWTGYMMYNQPKPIGNSVDISFNWQEYDDAIGNTGVPQKLSGPWPVTKEVAQMPTAMIGKTGEKYDPETHELTWNVTVNNSKAVLSGDWYLIDELINGGGDGTGNLMQTFANGNAAYVIKDMKQDGGTELHEGAGYTVGIEDGNLKITFDESALSGHTIEFDLVTCLTEDEINYYQSNSTGRRALNKISLYRPSGQDSINAGTFTADITPQINVLRKAGIGYDYNTREITWEVKANESKVPLEKPWIEDKLTGTLVNGSVKVSENDGTEIDITEIKEGVTAGSYPYYTYDGSTLKVYLADGESNSKYRVTFRTRMEDETVVSDNSEKQINTFNGLIQVTNEAVLHKEDSTDTKASGSQLFNNRNVSKDAEDGNGAILYKIGVNQNQCKWPKGRTVVDTMDKGLVFNPATVQLYEATVNPDGSLKKGNLVDKSQYSRDVKSLEDGKTQFSFTLPEAATGQAYILTYEATLDDEIKNDSSISKLANEITFENMVTGDNETHISSISKQQALAWSGAGTKSFSRIKVCKFDEDNNPLEGAVFELYYIGDAVPLFVTSKTTNANGAATFVGMTPGAEYMIKEVQAPAGYMIDDNHVSETFTAPDKGDDKYVTKPFEFVNIKKDYHFLKVDKDGNPLSGALFGLFSEGTKDFTEGNALDTAMSDEDGKVFFENAQFAAGTNYWIAELEAPAGWLTSDAVWVGEIDLNGDLTLYQLDDPDRKPVKEYMNQKAAEEPIVLYVRDRQGRALRGARFGLFRMTDDVLTDEPMLVAYSDENGRVVFDGVAAGEKYQIKELTNPEGYLGDGEVLIAVISDSGRFEKLYDKADSAQKSVTQVINYTKDGNTEDDNKTDDKNQNDADDEDDDDADADDADADDADADADDADDDDDVADQVSAENTEIASSVPKTGDNTPLACWAGLLAGSVTLLGVCVYVKKRMRSTEKPER